MINFIVNIPVWNVYYRVPADWVGMPKSEHFAIWFAKVTPNCAC